MPTTSVEIHEACKLFRESTDNEYREIRESIRDRIDKGLPPLLDRIAFHSGKLLDGRTRWKALEELGVDPVLHVVTLDDSVDPIEYSVTKNLHRRHLSIGEKALMGAQIATAYQKQNLEKKKQRIAGNDSRPNSTTASDKPIDAVAAGAGAAGVSKTSVKAAKKVVEGGSDDLKQMVAKSEVGVEAAAQVASLPKAEQTEVVSKGPEAVKAVAAKKRDEKKAESKKTDPKKAKEAKKSEKLDPEASPLGPIDRMKGLISQMDPCDALRVVMESCSTESQKVAVARLASELAGLPTEGVKQSSADAALEQVAKSLHTDPVAEVEAIWNGSSVVEQQHINAKVKELFKGIGKQPSEFERFWSAYPPKRRKDKANAEKAWNAAIKKLASSTCPHEGGWAEYLICRATEYAASPVGKGEYVKGPAPWLNGGCWDDAPEAWRTTGDKRINDDSARFDPSDVTGGEDQEL